MNSDLLVQSCTCTLPASHPVVHYFVVDWEYMTIVHCTIMHMYFEVPMTMLTVVADQRTLLC